MVDVGRVSLPIDAYLEEFGALVAKGNVVLVAEPGAGKTTRAPAGLLEARWMEGAQVVVVEPRRLAARLAARRVAAERGESVGETVGYEVRHERAIGARTRLRFMTEGILVRRFGEGGLADPARVFVLDEVHERSLQTDLALSLLRWLQQTSRPELRIVAMSATIEAEAMAAFLDATVLRVPGRAHPVTVEHAPHDDDRSLEERVRSAVAQGLRGPTQGDVLVFLPGAAEIRRAAEACAELCARHDLELTRLHGELSAEEQDRAIRPGKRRKVILSTNVAETSVTIEGVDLVIDSGLARVATYDSASLLPSLKVRPISQASATQRAGRAGRLRPGQCLRLYTRHDFQGRARHEKPEILRLDLAEACLLLHGLGHNPKQFAFFETPPAAALDAAEDLLAMLRAIAPKSDTADAARRGVARESVITALGRQMLELPLHPRLARVALEALERGVGTRGALVAALLAEREIRLDLRVRLDGRQGTNDEVGSSDVLDRLERFEEAEAERANARALRALELDGRAVQAVGRTRDQIARALGCARSAAADPLAPSEDEALRIAIASGYGDRVGARRNAASGAKGAIEVLLATGGAAQLDPRSVVKESALLVALDVEEGRSGTIVRRASAIEAEWLLELFPERVRDRNELRLNEKTGYAERRIALDYGAIVLDESVRREAAGPEVARLLVRAARSAGLARFFDMEAVEKLALRVEFARRYGLDMPPLGEEQVDEAIAELAEGATSLGGLSKHSLVEVLRYRLPASALRRLDELAPETVSIAGRAKVAVHYEAGRDPWLASRMQDFFGMARGPSIAGGGVPLVLHLLAPNQRAVQVTTDLEGFWSKHYPAIRQELCRRYPRHAWPDDPTRRPSPKR